jgi:ParB-like chromosome segregation protein Spo0J
MGKLIPHPVAGLFPDLPPADFAALVDDIRENGVKVPIVVHRGRILDGRHRYRACQQLRKPCPTTEWDGRDPWLEVQSRNLVRRHLTKDQICAIRMLAAKRFPELAAPLAAARAEAQQRKAQAKNQPRGIKALSRSQNRERESADVIGAQIGVSGTTVKRVDRLMRDAPELVPKVAAGELSVKKALGQIHAKRSLQPQEAPPDAEAFHVDAALRRLRQVVKSEWVEWPRAHRRQFLWALHQQLQDLLQEYRSTTGAPVDAMPERRVAAGA